MSLIIEDKTALDNLANAIIGANGSVTDKSVTKSGLIEMINNIIPEKSKFASGIYTPAEAIGLDNAPEIPFSLGNDDSGNVIVPDMILIYQPQSILDTPKATYMNIIIPELKRTESTTGSLIQAYRNSPTSTTKSDVQMLTLNQYYTQITATSFFINQKVSDTSSSYNWQAQMPIVWLQIKF